MVQHREVMRQTIRIHAAAPAKPAEGAACNGCGVCCLAEPCPIGVLASARRQGACRALRWNATGARYRCGLMAVPMLRRLVKRWIAAGQGCDSDAAMA
jgi:hypothetical protein